MAVSLTVLSTRAGVLRYPNEAAAILTNEPISDASPPLHPTSEVLQTRAGCLRFPTQAAEYIAELIPSSS